MIVDDVRNANRYKGLSEAFDRAFDALSPAGLSALPNGRTVIDGEKVFVNVMEKAYDRTEPKYECHARYADIQVILEGRESFVLGAGGEEPRIDPEKDIAVCGAEPLVRFTLGSGQFVIVFPGEKHAPGLMADPQPVRKAVVKVLCE